jgi:hypothetical protein
MVRRLDVFVTHDTLLNSTVAANDPGERHASYLAVKK